MGSAGVDEPAPAGKAKRWDWRLSVQPAGMPDAEKRCASALIVAGPIPTKAPIVGDRRAPQKHRGDDEYDKDCDRDDGAQKFAGEKPRGHPNIGWAGAQFREEAASRQGNLQTVETSGDAIAPTLIFTETNRIVSRRPNRLVKA